MLRHPDHRHRLPEAFLRVADHVLAGAEEDQETYELAWERAALLYDLDTRLLDHCRGRAVGPAPSLPHPATLFELSPFATNGGDGLFYAWCVHAPERDDVDFPCVAFAPSWTGARWLGAHTAEGMANLLVGREIEHHESGGPQPSTDPRWAALVQAIGHEPEGSAASIGRAGVSTRWLVPSVPARWRHVADDDGVGVLAPEDRFTVGAQDVDVSDPVGLAAELIASGTAASALVVLKRARQRDLEDPSLVSAMRDAYLALDRPMHAERAARWLRAR